MKICPVCPAGYDRYRCLVEFELSGKMCTLPCEIGVVEAAPRDCSDERLKAHYDLPRKGKLVASALRNYGSLYVHHL